MCGAVVLPPSIRWRASAKSPGPGMNYGAGRALEPCEGLRYAEWQYLE